MRSKFVGGPLHGQVREVAGKRLKAAVLPRVQDWHEGYDGQGYAISFKEVEYEAVREFRVFDLKSGRMDNYLEWEVVC